MAIIDPVGLFTGDRLRHCSNPAQLHWPRLFLSSDGFARLEINYARIVGTAYLTFNPIPSETEIQSFIQEYSDSFLLFLYEIDGRTWGQWDTRRELLPRYKTATDRRSPAPPEPAFAEWKQRYQRYREEHNQFPKSCGNIPETFLHGGGVGVGVGVVKNICASNPDAQACLPSIDNPPFGTLEPYRKTLSELQDEWFSEFWAAYWLKKGKIEAREAFGKHATSEEKKNHILAAVKVQSAEMLARPADKRKWAQGWLNALRFEDDSQEYAPASTNGVADAPAPGPRAAYHRKWTPPPIAEASHG